MSFKYIISSLEKEKKFLEKNIYFNSKLPCHSSSSCESLVQLIKCEQCNLLENKIDFLHYKHDKFTKNEIT